MARQSMVLAVCLSLILEALGACDSSITTESLVLKHGYPIETHTVTTNDGYILTMHRIPYSPRLPSTEPRRVVFVMHGLLCSSSDWVVLGAERSLGFILADAGFDVWLGNARGNTYSRKHVSLDPNSSSFWDFEWHEIGMIDLPTMIEYVRDNTGVKKVVYIGHSQGTTTFLLPHSRIQQPTIVFPIDLLGSYEFNPSQTLVNIIASIMCKKALSNNILCSNALFLAAGFDENTVDSTIINDVMATSPAGASTKQFLHYMQIYNSGYFRHFDYGMPRNLIKYGQTKPPNYPLANINVPIYLYYSDNDELVAVEDVEHLMDELKSLVKAYRVPDKQFDHLGQMFNKNIKRHVYDSLLANI